MIVIPKNVTVSGFFCMCIYWAAYRACSGIFRLHETHKSLEIQCGEKQHDRVSLPVVNSVAYHQAVPLHFEIFRSVRRFS